MLAVSGKLGPQQPMPVISGFICFNTLNCGFLKSRVSYFHSSGKSRLNIYLSWIYLFCMGIFWVGKGIIISNQVTVIERCRDDSFCRLLWKLALCYFSLFSTHASTKPMGFCSFVSLLKISHAENKIVVAIVYEQWIITKLSQCLRSYPW